MPFRVIAEREKSDESAHSKEKGRDEMRLFDRLVAVFEADEDLVMEPLVESTD
jgi:hypothetical protein